MYRRLPAAATAYQKSAEFGVADDKSCPYDPLENGVGIYTIETREYGKAWEMVHQAQKFEPADFSRVDRTAEKDSGRIN